MKKLVFLVALAIAYAFASSLSAQSLHFLRIAKAENIFDDFSISIYQEQTITQTFVRKVPQIRTKLNNKGEEVKELVFVSVQYTRYVTNEVKVPLEITDKARFARISGDVISIEKLKELAKVEGGLEVLWLFPGNELTEDERALLHPQLIYMTSPEISAERESNTTEEWHSNLKETIVKIQSCLIGYAIFFAATCPLSAQTSFRISIARAVYNSSDGLTIVYLKIENYTELESMPHSFTENGERVTKDIEVHVQKSRTVNAEMQIPDKAEFYRVSGVEVPIREVEKLANAKDGLKFLLLPRGFELTKYQNKVLNPNLIYMYYPLPPAP